MGMRHVVATDSRAQFLTHLDLLLEERVLIGDGITGAEQLRPFQISFLADLVHFLRPELSSPQFIRVVQMYTRYLHDQTLTPGLQNLCTKALVGLQEYAIRKLGHELGGRLLMNLLDSYVSKLFAVRTVSQDLLAMTKSISEEKRHKEQHANHTAADEDKTEEPESGPYTIPDFGSIEKMKPVQRAAFSHDSPEEVIKGVPDFTERFPSYT